jgi:hypothetical protein
MPQVRQTEEGLPRHWRIQEGTEEEVDEIQGEDTNQDKLEEYEMVV